MTPGSFVFDEFALDPGERLLCRGGVRLDLSGRYLDALLLLVREQGRLVTKDRFLAEVWRGVPVTDEVLTQCIRTLRRRLGDEAARPRFIETVPKHGYRFIAEVGWRDAETDGGPRRSPTTTPPATIGVPRLAGAAALGGAVAGVGGGLVYGLAATPPAPDGGMGAVSVLLVLTVLGMVIGCLGGLGVGAGIAVAGRLRGARWQWVTFGGMAGGLAVGGIVKILGVDAFSLLIGRSPLAMTGAGEGALLGGALGLAASIAHRRRLGPAGSAAIGGMAGATAGLLVPLLGGHLLGGSLAGLARAFPDARFRLDRFGALFGESGLGRVGEAVTATAEGALFGLCVLAALAMARRGRGDGTGGAAEDARPGTHS